jgi:hypothetical protein
MLLKTEDIELIRVLFCPRSGKRFSFYMYRIYRFIISECIFESVYIMARHIHYTLVGMDASRVYLALYAVSSCKEL